MQLKSSISQKLVGVTGFLRRHDDRNQRASSGIPERDSGMAGSNQEPSPKRTLTMSRGTGHLAVLYPGASVRDFGEAPSDRIRGIRGDENRHDSGPLELAHDVLLVLKPFAAPL